MFWPLLARFKAENIDRNPSVLRRKVTNGFSKKIDNHAAQIATFMVVCNFHRKHMTLGTTTAVKAGIADHIWSIEEIIGLLEKREQAENGVAA